MKSWVLSTVKIVWWGGGRVEADCARLEGQTLGNVSQTLPNISVVDAMTMDESIRVFVSEQRTKASDRFPFE